MKSGERVINAECGIMGRRWLRVKEFAMRIVKETSSVKERVPHREGSANADVMGRVAPNNAECGIRNAALGFPGKSQIFWGVAANA